MYGGNAGTRITLSTIRDPGPRPVKEGDRAVYGSRVRFGRRFQDRPCAPRESEPIRHTTAFCPSAPQQLFARSLYAAPLSTIQPEPFRPLVHHDALAIPPPGPYRAVALFRSHQLFDREWTLRQGSGQTAVCVSALAW